MVRLERALGAAISIIGIGIALFMTFCVAYYFMPNMLESHYSRIEEVLASWTPQIIMTAMLMILGIGFVKLGSSLMRHAAPERTKAVEVEETPAERAPPPFTLPRTPGPPETRPRPSEREERPTHMAFEAAIREEVPFPTPRPSRPRAGEIASQRPAPQPTGREGHPEARPALDEDELSRIIRILRERRRKT